MTTVGRNDPCPCGSGKKYKRCCLLKESTIISDDLLWRNVRNARDGVHQKVEQYSREFYVKEDLLVAWDEWCLDFEEPIGTNEKEFGLFMTWFLHNWTCPRLPEPRARMAIKYLANRFSSLSEKEQEYLKSLLEEPITFYEVIEARAGHGIHMRCILTGRELYVSERSGSQGVHPGDIFFGRLGVMKSEGDTAIFDAVSDILIPPAWKGEILELRQDLKRLKRVKKDSLLKPAHVLDFETDIRDVYREIRDRALNPKPPRLVNTDGEELSFNKVIYEIDSSNDAFKALHTLCFNETFDSLLDRATVSMDNNIVEVEFPWLKKGNKTHRGMENTVLGHITIEKNKMTITVNSLKREAAIKEIIKKRCKGNARYKTTLIEPLEAKLAEHRARQTPASSEEHAKEQQELMNHPEVKAKLQEMQRKHMEAWATERIPALGNKTPVQAMKTAEGREMVIALLSDFERSAGKLGDREFELELIEGIKRKLGLSEGESDS
ncbi:SEC-C metal-binding domain-containing protein [Bdellovibrionota bacterium FG-2]